MSLIPKYISFLRENRTKGEAVKIYNQRLKDSYDDITLVICTI